MNEASKTWRWERDDFVISSDQALVPIDTLLEAWASDLLPWATAPDPDTMRMILDRSLTLCLYKKNESSTFFRVYS
jgi:hypothetical protein